MRDYYDAKLSPRALATSAAYLGGRFGVKVEAGRSWECDVKSKTLYYPAHELERFTRVEAVALLIHEIGHAADTSPMLYKKGQKMVDRFGKEIAALTVNALEDWRIDYRAARRYANGEEIIEEMNRQACASNRRELYDVAGIDQLLESKKRAQEALCEYQAEVSKGGTAAHTTPLNIPESPAALRAMYDLYRSKMLDEFVSMASTTVSLAPTQIAPMVERAFLSLFPTDDEKKRVLAALEKIRADDDGGSYGTHPMPARALISQIGNIPTHPVAELVAWLANHHDMASFAVIVRTVKAHDDNAAKQSPAEKMLTRYKEAQRAYSAGAIRRVLLTASLMAYGEDMPRPIKPTAWKRGGSGKVAKWKRNSYGGWSKTEEDTDDDYYSDWYAEQDAKAEERYMLSLDLWERASMIADEVQLPVITADTTGAVYKIIADKVAPILWDLVADDVAGEDMDTPDGNGGRKVEAAGQRADSAATKSKAGFNLGSAEKDGRIDWGAARKAVRRDAAATFAKIRRMVQENARQRFAGRFTSGRLNAGKLYKAGIVGGDTRLFQRRVARKNYDFAASVVIDVSGSMTDPLSGSTTRRYKAALEVAALISDAVAEARGKVEIVAFSYDVSRGVRFGEKVRDDHVSRFVSTVFGGGTNIDKATKEAMESLNACPSEKKAMFVITDADLPQRHHIDADAYCYQVGGTPRERVYRDASKHYVVRNGNRRALVDRVARDVKRFTSGQ